MDSCPPLGCGSVQIQNSRFLQRYLRHKSITNDNLRTCPLCSIISCNFRAYQSSTPGTRESTVLPSRERTSNYSLPEISSPHLCCWPVTTPFLQFCRVVTQHGSQQSYYVCQRLGRFHIRLPNLYGFLFCSCAGFRITTFTLVDTYKSNNCQVLSRITKKTSFSCTRHPTLTGQTPGKCTIHKQISSGYNIDASVSSQVIDRSSSMTACPRIMASSDTLHKNQGAAERVRRSDHEIDEYWGSFVTKEQFPMT